MNLQENSHEHTDEAVQAHDILNRQLGNEDELESIKNLTEFEEDLGHADELEFADCFYFDDDSLLDVNQSSKEIKQVNIPPLFDQRSDRPIFNNFLEFEAHYTDASGLRYNVNLENNYVTLKEQSNFFDIVLRFSNNETAYAQIKYYKKILNNIARLKHKLNKVMNVLKANNITEVPQIVLASSYNEVFPYWVDKKSHLVAACYQSDTIYIFANYKLKRCLKLKDTKHSLIHELGHMIEDRLYYQAYKCKNKYSNLIRQDFKLALKTKTSRVLNYKRYAGFYDHVAPPTTFTKLTHEHVLESSPAHELFAESLTYYMEFNGRKFKRRYKEVNSPILNEMFPNTNYIVKQTVLGKSVNKYKVLKQKKMTKMIKL
jgi:hypothetical protein